MKLVGIASSGFHSNGFSLLRKLFAPDLEAWRDVLLKPTALYVRLVQAAVASGGLEAVAHITGGGMDNLPRVLPDNTKALVRSWPVPSPFLEVKKRSGLKWADMLTTLNCGIGMIWVVQPDQVQKLIELSAQHGHAAFALGEVQAYSGEATWTLEDPSWEGWICE